MADRVLIMENAYYSVISPEGCAAILWKDRAASAKAAQLVPGHCDPTVNLHDWFVGVRRGVVEALWPVSARGAIW